MAEVTQGEASEEQTNFIEVLRSSNRILAIIGAGLSRPSGLPTFRQDLWFWGRAVEDIGTRTAFEKNPIYVWTVYERLRQLALASNPNLGHFALAALADAKPELLAISQNIDDLSQRAGHDPHKLVALHGSIFDVQCTNEQCDFTCRNTSESPTVPGLFIDPYDIRDSEISLSHLNRHNVPPCPGCGLGTVRPGIVWFGERLPDDALARIDDWFNDAPEIDLVLLIGTQRTPFVHEALARGARVASFNIHTVEDETGAIDAMHEDTSCVESEDLDVEDAGDFEWLITGDASRTLPYIIGSALEIDFFRNIRA